MINKTRPRVGNIEITHKCNFNCPICYNSRYNIPELSTTQFKKLFQAFANEGCFYIHFSGGEPLLRQDFCELYQFCAELGIRPSVESNGSVLTHEHLDLFKRLPPIILYISIYGITAETFKSSTMSSFKNHRAVMQNILTLKDNEIPVSLRTPISIFNYFEADIISDYCKEIDIPHSYSPLVWWNQTGRRLDQYRVTSKQLAKITRQHPVFDNLKKMVAKLEGGPFYARTCRVGIDEFYISPHGEMHLCHNFWSTKYNLMHGTFQDAWNNWLPQFRNEDEEWCLSKQLSPVGKCPYGEIYFDINQDPSLSLESRIQIQRGKK